MEQLTRTEAIHLFNRHTGAAGDMAATAYLPNREDPDTCPKCIDRVAHAHTMRPTYMPEEVQQAAAEFMQDEYEREIDRAIWRAEGR